MNGGGAILNHRLSCRQICICTIAGLGAAAAATQLGNLRPRLVYAAVGGLVALCGILVSGYVKPALLLLWALLLTYNRQYFLFERITGPQGAQGPYIIVADVFLFLLLAHWAFELIVLKLRPKPRGGRLAVWLLPFAAVALVSTTQAEHPAWSLFEMIRLLRIGIICLYFRYNVGRAEWWACAAGFGAAVLFQGAVGTLELITGRSGLGGILGLSNLEAEGPAALRQEALLGFRRATGTMSHPPNLACFLLMFVPACLGLGLAARSTRLRWVAGLSGLIGLCGLGCTLSRWPWAVMACQAILLVAGLAALRVISVMRAIGVSCIVGFLLCASVVPFADRIADRMTRDFDRSIDFRVKENHTALEIIRDNPLLGVGLNNYREHLLRYAPEWAWAFQFEDFSVKQLRLRPIAAPHNGFLLIAAESGVLGLTAFVLFLLVVMAKAARSVALTGGAVQVACLGLLIGLIGLIIQQAVDFSIWADPLLYSLIGIGTLVNLAPSLFPRSQEAPV